METRDNEQSQAHRMIAKRPWGDESKDRQSRRDWQRHTLPPIDVTTISRSTPFTRAYGTSPSSQHGSAHDLSAKRARLGEKGNCPPSRAGSYAAHDETRPFLSPINDVSNSRPRATSDYASSIHPGMPDRASGGPDDISKLCPRCRRPFTVEREDHNTTQSEIHESCDNSPELANITQAAAAGLYQLADTLLLGATSGKSRSDICTHSNQSPDASVECLPPLADYGLRYTLAWLVESIDKINDMATGVVHQIPPSIFSKLDLKSPFDVRKPSQHDLIDHTRNLPEGTPDGGQREGMMPTSRNHKHSKPETSAMTPNDDYRPMQARYVIEPGAPAKKGQHQHPSIMNPPPPHRQLPSPPARSLPSPTSTTFPSPSSSSAYGTGPFGGNISSHSNLPPLSSCLPPISTGQSSDQALQAHAAALQHEVSIQKVALSSLQGEHDKLLAAFSRSQLRASALEKKHAVSDNEIITLTEEKIRLQSQVAESERDVEEITQSRDEYRQSGVQENTQYVEIVKRASLLEEKTAVEKTEWKELKAALEKKLITLREGRKIEATHAESSTGIVGTVNESGIKESKGPSDTSATIAEPVDILREQVEHLRKRCQDAENALRAVREQSLSLDKVVEVLNLTKKDITKTIEDVGIDSTS